MNDWTNYELLDFGEGRKLERFGAWVLDRPCPAAATVKGFATERLGRRPNAKFGWRAGGGWGLENWPVNFALDGELTLDVPLGDERAFSDAPRASADGASRRVPRANVRVGSGIVAHVRAV